MKKNLFLNLRFTVIFFVIILGGCSQEKETVSSNLTLDASNLTGNWKVAYYIDNGQTITKADKATWPDINGGDITAVFSEPDNSGKGTISGIIVTNGYEGNYFLNENNLTIESISTTFANQPEWAELFKITGAESFEVNNSELMIFYNERRNVIVFEKN